MVDTLGKQRSAKGAIKSEDASVFSKNFDIQQLAVKPVHALINLVGAKESTHQELSELIQNGMRDHVFKQSQSPNYAPPLLRIQSFDMPVKSKRAAIRRAQPHGDQAGGILKRNFFHSFAYNKPAITIFVFDWREWPLMHPADEVFDWKTHESLVLDKIREHNAEWLADLSVNPRYMIIVLFPSNLASHGASGQPPLTVESCLQSFRRAVTLAGNEMNLGTHYYFLQDGFDSLKTSMNKKFAKNLHELVTAYYREKKDNIKKKQKRLIQGQTQHIRYGMHMALYSLVTSNEFSKTITRLEASYGQLKSLQMAGGAVRGQEEKRENADVLAMTILSLQLQAGLLAKFVDFFRHHFAEFQREIHTARPEVRLDEMKWRSNWFFVAGQMLERFYKKQGGLDVSRRGWHVQHSLDSFPGYYFFNSMLQLVARQQELQRMRLDAHATGKPVFDAALLDSVVRVRSAFLGREFSVAETPASKQVRGDRAEECLYNYRVFEECRVHLGVHILTAGQIAIGYFKQRGQLLKGPTVQVYQRTVHLINFHIAELLDKPAPPDEEEGEPSYDVVSVTEKQKLRRQIQTFLTKEKWIDQAVSLTEKSKNDSASLDEFFHNEMKILLHASALKNHKRHARLLDLIERVQTEPLDGREGLKFTGIISGTHLLWARARFQHSKIQINKFNRLTLEVFSRLKTPIKVQKLTIMMSQVDLNQEIDFSKDESIQENFFSLCKSNPIKIERSFYLENEDNLIGQIMLNQILLELAPKKLHSALKSFVGTTPPQSNKVFFSISPYLAPEEPAELLALDTASAVKRKKVKRLPPPIMYRIDPMPHKIEAALVLSDAQNQALLGDSFACTLTFRQVENVKLKSLKAVFVDFASKELAGGTFKEVSLEGSSRPMSKAKTFGASVVDMQSVGVDQSTLTLQQSTTRLHSLFRPEMSTFYANASRLMKSAASQEAGSRRDLFMGADPTLGVTVLTAGLGPVDERSQADGELDRMAYVPVELFYAKGAGPRAPITFDEEHADESGATMLTQQEVDLLDAEGNIADLHLHMMFFQEGHLNNLSLQIAYEFTQNEGIENEAVHAKAFDYNVLVQSQSPFQVEWQVKSADSFLASLQNFYSTQVRGAETLKQVAAHFAKAEGVGGLPIKEEVLALTSKMVAVEEQTCWLVCKLTSLAQYKDLRVSDFSIQLNPDVAEFVKVVERVGCYSSGPTSLLDEQGEDEDEPLCLEPGETYEVLFKLQIGKPAFALSLDGIEQAGQKSKQYTRVAPELSQEPSLGEQLVYLKRLYELTPVEIFAELHFQWSSYEARPESTDSLINLSGAEEPAPRRCNPPIMSCVGSPQMNLVSRPLSIRILNKLDIETVRLYEPFTVEYEIANLTDRVIIAITEMQSYPEGNVRVPFLVAGEIKSRLYLMPSDDSYVLRFNLFPQQLGHLTLPRLTISDMNIQQLQLVKDFTGKVYVTSK